MYRRFIFKERTMLLCCKHINDVFCFCLFFSSTGQLKRQYKWSDEETVKNWSGKAGIQQKIANKCRNLNKSFSKKNSAYLNILKILLIGIILLYLSATQISCYFIVSCSSFWSSLISMWTCILNVAILSIS